MKVVRLSDVKPYETQKHHDMVALRLQGHGVTPTEHFWVGLSHFLPGGGADWDATPFEKVYVVLTGEVTVRTESGEETLRPYDSCYLAPGEGRALENRTNLPASILVIMPYQRGEAS